MRGLLVVAGGLLLGLWAGSAAAETSWPVKPITIVAAGAAGSSSDFLIRAIFDPVSKALGVPIVPEFKPGAGTTLAATHAAQQPADGNTFFLASVAPLAIAPRLYKDAKYDPVRDFSGVAKLTTGQNVLFVGKAVPASTVAEFVALAKAQPGKMNIGIGAGGSSFHMATVSLPGTRASNWRRSSTSPTANRCRQR